MDTTSWIIVAAVLVVAIIILVAWISFRRRRLRSRFGPEYQRVVEQSGSKWRADSELAARQERRQQPWRVTPVPVQPTAASASRQRSW